MAGINAKVKTKTPEEQQYEAAQQAAKEAAIADIAEKASKRKGYLEKCSECNKDLTAFVATNGLRFCCDDHAQKHFAA